MLESGRLRSHQQSRSQGLNTWPAEKDGTRWSSMEARHLIGRSSKSIMNHYINNDVIICVIFDKRMLPCHKRSSQPSRKARWCQRCAGASWSRCGVRWLHRWRSWLSWLKNPSAHTWPREYEEFPGHCEGNNRIIQMSVTTLASLIISHVGNKWIIIRPHQLYYCPLYPCMLSCVVLL